MFDDRIEVRSPGLPPEPVTVDGLNRRMRLHLSRNPLIMRTLAALGYVSDLGEGIPRMFAEMEREGFYPPRFEDVGGLFFEITLRNEPIYDRATLEWLRQFDPFGLSGDQKRLLAYARAHGDRFTSREYQKLTGLDLYRASNSIKELIRRGVARSAGKGSRVYEIQPPNPRDAALPKELEQVFSTIGRTGSLTNHEVQQALRVSRLTAARYLRRWVEEGWLRLAGRGRWSRYEPTSRLNVSLSK